MTRRSTCGGIDFTMVRKIALKEIRETARDRRLCMGLALVPALLAIILTSSRREATALDSTQKDAQSASRRNWLEQGRRDPHGAAHHGTFLFKARPPLALFDPGLDPYLGTSVRLEAHKQHRPTGLPAADSPDPLRIDASTPALTLQIVLPLVIILLGFSAVSGERERGTLPLLLSLGVPLRRLVLGKAAALALIVALLASPVAAAFAWAIADGSAGGLRADVAWRSALLVLGYAGYLGGWIFLALAASERAGSSRMALLGLLATWAATTLVMPRLAVEAARRLHPLPTQESFEDETKKAQRTADGGNRFVEIQKELEARLLEEHGVEKKEDLPINFEGASMLAAEEFTDAVHDRVNGALEEAFLRQDRVEVGWSFASPFLALRSASRSLSGTDRLHHEAFCRAAEGHRRHLVRTMNEALLHRKPRTKGGEKEEPPGRELWEKVQEFRYEPPSWEAAAREAAPRLAAIGGWFALAAGLALIASPRAGGVE